MRIIMFGPGNRTHDLSIDGDQPSVDEQHDNFKDIFGQGADHPLTKLERRCADKRAMAQS